MCSLKILSSRLISFKSALLNWFKRKRVFLLILIGINVFSLHLLLQWFASSDYKLSFHKLGLSEMDKVKELWKQPSLLNLPNFTWSMNNETRCQITASHKVYLLPVLIHSARSNFEARLAIRKSWGSVPIYKSWDVRTVFLLGQANQEENHKIVESRLQEEQAEFGDLVIGSFVDSYRNLTFKHLMGYKWVLNFCSNATFVLKADDDIFVDILNWLDHRTTDLESGNASQIPEFYCYAIQGKKPIRSREGPLKKWYVSMDEWSSDSYPNYCTGWAYGITVALMERLYSVSNNVNPLWIDDVFVTGVLMEEVKKAYKLSPEIRYYQLTDENTDFTLYYRMCKNGAWDSQRKFPDVVYVSRDYMATFERDMVCLWNKTWHDSVNKINNQTLYYSSQGH